MSATAALLSHEEVLPLAVERIEGTIELGVLILCDHASNAIPEEYANLGLPAAELDRHIAYDIGAAAVTRALARRLDAPAILTRFSRLLIDPNRGRDDPTLVMRLSDGAVIPGNRGVDEAEVARRVRRFYDPYDAAIRLAIEWALCADHPPLIVAIHSFTPFWRGLAAPGMQGSCGIATSASRARSSTASRPSQGSSSATTSPMMVRLRATPSTATRRCAASPPR